MTGTRQDNPPGGRPVRNRAIFVSLPALAGRTNSPGTFPAPGDDYWHQQGEWHRAPPMRARSGTRTSE